MITLTHAEAPNDRDSNILIQPNAIIAIGHAPKNHRTGAKAHIELSTGTICWVKESPAVVLERIAHLTDG